MERGRILYVGNNPSYFLMHRLPVARAARDAGYEVHVALPDSSDRPRIEAEGFRLHAVPFVRGSRIGVLDEIRTLAALARLYRALRPDIIHHHTIKPILYGGSLARMLGVRAVAFGVTGLGYVFVSNALRARAIRALVKPAYRFALGHPRSRAVFENADDLADFVRWGLASPERAEIIQGAGIDVEEFRPGPEPAGPPVVVLAARMLWDKGVGEFVEAARRLRAAGTEARFVLVGDVDPGNPESIARETLAEWAREGAVEWRGFCADMPKVFADAHIACLPSYREGLPRALLEAAACGKPLVAADAPGCREAVRHGDSGLLVPPRDAAALAEALRRLLEDAGLRRRMGERARAIAAAEFSAERVVSRTLALYDELPA